MIDGIENLTLVEQAFSTSIFENLITDLLGQEIEVGYLHIIAVGFATGLRAMKPMITDQEHELLIEYYKEQCNHG